MTESTAPQATTGPPRGADLARLALHQARLAAKSNGDQTRAPRRRPGPAGKRDGREPAGFAAVLAGLMAERAWEVPATGGNVLHRWPAIAAAVSPRLPDHVHAVAFDPASGRLDLRPDSPAYATQLRLITARIIAAANEAVGTRAVRQVRVLPPGFSPAAAPARGAAADPAAAAGEGTVRTRSEASPGYHRALAALQAAKATGEDRLAPAVRAAAQRQARDQVREPEEASREDQALLDEQAERAARRQAASPADAARARALTCLPARRTGLPAARPTTPDAASAQLGRTA